MFFSFVGNKANDYLFSDWNFRKDHLKENNDSHTFILDNNNIKTNRHHHWSKYEFNPLTKRFTIDSLVDGQIIKQRNIL
jgi:hypothetical protein